MYLNKLFQVNVWQTTYSHFDCIEYTFTRALVKGKVLRAIFFLLTQDLYLLLREKLRTWPLFLPETFSTDSRLCPSREEERSKNTEKKMRNIVPGTLVDNDVLPFFPASVSLSLSSDPAHPVLKFNKFLF